MWCGARGRGWVENSQALGLGNASVCCPSAKPCTRTLCNSSSDISLSMENPMRTLNEPSVPLASTLLLPSQRWWPRRQLTAHGAPRIAWDRELSCFSLEHSHIIHYFVTTIHDFVPTIHDFVPTTHNFVRTVHDFAPTIHNFVPSFCLLVNDRHLNTPCKASRELKHTKRPLLTFSAEVQPKEV